MHTNMYTYDSRLKNLYDVDEFLANAKQALQH